MIYVCKFVCHFSTPLKSRSKECATMPAPTFLTKYTCENDNNLFLYQIVLVDDASNHTDITTTLPLYIKSRLPSKVGDW